MKLKRVNLRHCRLTTYFKNIAHNTHAAKLLRPILESERMKESDNELPNLCKKKSTTQWAHVVVTKQNKIRNITINLFKYMICAILEFFFFFSLLNIELSTKLFTKGI